MSTLNVPTIIRDGATDTSGACMGGEDAPLLELLDVKILPAAVLGRPDREEIRVQAAACSYHARIREMIDA